MASISTNPTLAEIARLIRSIDFGPDASRLLIRVARLIARGRPVAPDRVAGIIDDLGIDKTKAFEHLTAYTERDDNGDIVGAGPITLKQTSHRFTTETAQVWASCPMDTLILPAVVNEEARVASQPPGSKDIVRFTATPHGVFDVEPAGAVVSIPGFVPPTSPTEARHLVVDLARITAAEQIWDALCRHVHSFGSLADAQRRFADRDDVAFLALSDAFDVLRGFTDRFLAYEAQPNRGLAGSREFVRFVQALSIASSYPELERAFLDGFGRVLDAPMYGLHFFDPVNGRVLHSVNVNISDACIARYEQQAMAEDPLLAYVVKTRRAAYNLALMSMEEWLASPVYRKALHLHDVRHAITAPVIDSRGVVGTLCFATSDPDGSYSPEDVELAEALGRLIGDARERIETAERLKRERDRALSALDLGGPATVINDPQLSNGALNALTAREREIAILVSEGLSDRNIADRLHLSYYTVSQYTKQIYRKLHVDSRVALTRLLLTSHALGAQG